MILLNLGYSRISEKVNHISRRRKRKMPTSASTGRVQPAAKNTAGCPFPRFGEKPIEI